MALLDYFDLHEWDLKAADRVVEAVCDKYNVDYDAIMWEARNDFFNAFTEEPTKWIVERMFERLADSLNRNCGIDKERIDYDTNGMCADFYIDEEQAY